MDIVALTELGTTAEVEAAELASNLGITPYEARQRLAAGMPCVVLVTGDRARATSLLGILRGRHHGAVACEARAVVASSAMVPVRRFHFDAEALVVEARNDGAADDAAERVPYRDVIALVRATHRHSFETHEETKEKKFRPAAALATGGVVLTKTVTRDVVRTGEDREQVLYIYRRGHFPCLLREGGAQYAGLGSDVQPTRAQNFLTTVRLLREHAARAPYDDRLISAKRAPEPPNLPGAPRSFDPETGGTDLLAHLIAMWLSSRA